MSAAPRRIPDLRRPQYTPAQRAALDAGARTDVELTVDAVLGAAVDRAGLDDFGSRDFVARLALWCDEMDHDPQRTGLGRATFFTNCVRYAVSRLRVVELLDRHPEIHDEDIRGPIVVVGLPRSGTTHLVNLIAADPRLRSLPLWESLEPVPAAGEGPGEPGQDARHARAARSWEDMRTTLPAMEVMHPMAPDHVHEELELQMPDFASYSLEWHARCPRWRDDYLATDQTPRYAWLRTMLRVLQWYRPGERWVLKCPQHLEQLGPLLTTFPDSTVVFTHRDPVSVVQSAITMLTYVARMNYTDPDPDWYRDYWIDRVDGLLTASMRDRPSIAPAPIVDVLFHDLAADDLAVLDRVYEAAGLTRPDDVRAAQSAYSSAHARERAPSMAYDLRGDFGVTPDEVRARFGAYLDAFPIRLEVT